MDRDEEGMRVISDLHGGDPEDLLAKAEFQEIKDRVIFEVRHGSDRSLRKHLRTDSVRVERAERMPSCGNVTSVVYFLLCPRKLSLSWYVEIVFTRHHHH